MAPRSHSAGAGRSLSRQLKQLESVPDDAVDELVRWILPRSEQIGGRMMWFGKRVKLSARPKKRRHDRDSAAVTIVGVPISCWSIKSYGRKGDYPVKPRRAKALSLRAFAPGAFFAHVTVRSGTTGDRRWDRLMAEVEQRFPALVDKAIDRVVR